jgi:hypothetical protein
MKYLVWFHDRQTDERLELPGVGRYVRSEEHPVYGMVHAFEYRPVRDFITACEYLDAVAMYEVVME